MTRHSFGWLVLALTGLAACAPKSSSYGPPQDADTSGTLPSGGGGAGGSGGATGGGGAAGGATGGGGTGGAAPGIDCFGTQPESPCMEDGSLPPPGSYGPVPSKCTCQDEMPLVLFILACDAKNHHDIFQDSCGSAVAVPPAPPAQTYYRPVTGQGTDFETGDSDSGWLCLGYTTPKVVHCKYSYTRGSAPLTVAAGGQGISDPQSFEVAAQGDKDGDGNLATFTIIGDAVSGGGTKVLLGPLLQFDADE